jgi:hypothetical protein
VDLLVIFAHLDLVGHNLCGVIVVLVLAWVDAGDIFACKMSQSSSWDVALQYRLGLTWFVLFKVEVDTHEQQLHILHIHGRIDKGVEWFIRKLGIQLKFLVATRFAYAYLEVGPDIWFSHSSDEKKDPYEVETCVDLFEAKS